MYNISRNSAEIFNLTGIKHLEWKSGWIHCNNLPDPDELFYNSDTVLFNKKKYALQKIKWNNHPFLHMKSRIFSSRSFLRCPDSQQWFKSNLGSKVNTEKRKKYVYARKGGNKERQMQEVESWMQELENRMQEKNRNDRYSRYHEIIYFFQMGAAPLLFQVKQ